MKDNLILPLTNNSNQESYRKADDEAVEWVSDWINTRIELAQRVWSRPSLLNNKTTFTSPFLLADEIVTILTHRMFTFQSKKNLIQVLPILKQNLVRQIVKGVPIKIFLLYNGGYRASSFPNQLSLIFEPDQTEMMLLYQISKLYEKIKSIYSPGIHFVIVVNNGVAHWVNEIPLEATENYAYQLRNMIDFLRASSQIQVLLQSELEGFEPHQCFDSELRSLILTEKEHGIVERFLGHRCSKEEAIYRAGLYQLAESAWSQLITSIATESDAIMLRQVAHSDMLSFRAFPGGAIRIQNGSFGFQYLNNTLKPKLITSENVKQMGVKWAPYSLPWILKSK
ncbi:L-tyrosine/L-tryptophan isonitrile synthase family protein [Aquirufa sp. ROCK-SH2]